MRERQDITGKKFGRLTVVGNEIDNAGKTVQICLCECGGSVKSHTYRLTKGILKSCGCLIADKARERMLKTGAHLARRYQMEKPLQVKEGDVSGMLTVIREADPVQSGPRRRRAVLCACQCGSQTVVTVKDLVSGNTKSCGCLVKIGTQTTHGHWRDRKPSPEYGCWNSMRQRCLNPLDKSFRHYGLVGIKVAEEWGKFENFLRDMGPRPSILHSLDRYPNKCGNYEKGNVRWATKSQQTNNRNPFLTIREKADRSKREGIHMILQYARLRYEFSPEDLFELSKKINEWIEREIG